MPKILIVDDSMLQRLKLKKLFSTNGYETKEANSGEQAVTFLDQESFDSVSLDLLMPGMGGLGVLKEMKDKECPPIVVISADIQETIKEECISLGASGFMNKPAKDQELLDLFEEIIQ